MHSVFERVAALTCVSEWLEISRRLFMISVKLIGIIASIFTAFSLIPQLVKMVKEKKAGNISLLMLVILFGGLALWIYYGVMVKDNIIIISNSVSILLNMVILFFTLKFKNNT